MLPEKSTFQSPASISIPAIAWANGNSDIAAPMAIACLIRAFINSLRFGVLGFFVDVEDRGRPRPCSLAECVQELYQSRHGSTRIGPNGASNGISSLFRPLVIQWIRARDTRPALDAVFAEICGFGANAAKQRRPGRGPPECPARGPDMSHSVLD